MKTITVTREVTLTRIETLVVEVPENTDLDDAWFDPRDYVVLTENHEPVDVIDSSAWEVQP